jgi:enoyl-CoA hydratase/carnithine racemase
VNVPGRVHCSVDGRIARVVLSHPGKLNAMCRAMWRELRAVFDDLQARSAELRCVLVAGEAGSFCAGGDISEYPAFRFDKGSLADFHESDVWGGLGAMLACDLPVVAAIEGACMGAGLEIACCCDIRIAGESAKFGAPIAKLGFPMAPREAMLVGRVAGETTAREMLLEAAVLSAGEMKSRGFLTRLVPQGQAGSQAELSASRIAELSPQAARLNKQALRALSFSAAVGEAAYSYADSAEHREGIAAFLEKRKPQFKDR